MSVKKHPPTPVSATPPEPGIASTPASQRTDAMIIGGILQAGVTISAAVIGFGVLLQFLQPGGLAAASLTSFPRTFPQIWRELWSLHPQAVISLGLILLIATPVIRVAASVVVFLLERDYRFVVITLIVLAILVISLAIGKGG